MARGAQQKRRLGGEEAWGARSVPQSVNQSLGQSAVTHPCGGWGGGERSRSGTPPPPVAAGLSRPLARRDRPFHSGQGTLRCAAAAAERKHARTHARTHERTHARTHGALGLRRCDAAGRCPIGARGGATGARRLPAHARHRAPTAPPPRHRTPTPRSSARPGAEGAWKRKGAWRERSARAQLSPAAVGSRGGAGCRLRAGAVLGGRAASGVRVRRDEAGGRPRCGSARRVGACAERASFSPQRSSFQ